MSRKFQRRIENFTCGHCGAAVMGDGYTNHCPHCLYSRHVDVNPGDRAHDCGGLMVPVAVEQTGEGYVITHQCQKCGHTARCKAGAADDTAAIVAVARSRADPRG